MGVIAKMEQFLYQTPFTSYKSPVIVVFLLGGDAGGLMVGELLG
jgi:hypothetical protein